MAVERLQKILSNAGVASRREAEEMILAGRVAVNGATCAELGARADLETDEVTVDGVPVVRDRYRYFLLNKPTGVVTTADDDRGRETVLDLVPIGDIQLHPVGRLDMDSEGLLLLTNDGHLTDLLTHPRYEVEKEYLVGLDAPLSKSDMYRIVRGIESGDDRLRAISAQQALAPPATFGDEPPVAPAWALLVLREGKNREIRRMMEVLGREVLLLRRIRLGPVHLRELSPGAFRELTAQEVSALYNSAKQAEARTAPPGSSTAFAPRQVVGRKPSASAGGPGRVAPARPPKGPGAPANRGPSPAANRGKPASAPRPGVSGGPQRGAFGGRKSAFAGPPAAPGDGPPWPGRPDARPSRPGARPADPRFARPDTRPSRPGARPADPRSGRPDTRPSRPGARDADPRSGRPDTRPSRPGARPADPRFARPDTRPSRPGARDAAPGTGRPDARLSGPRAYPGARDADPRSGTPGARPGASKGPRRPGGPPPPRGGARSQPPRDSRGPRRGGPRA